MEKLTPKHNHTFTDILKVGIFGLFLLMPFLVFLPSALYYGFNEHAQTQTTVKEGGWEVRNKYETNEVNDITTDLVEGNIYHCDEANLISTNEEGVSFEIEILSLERCNFTNNNVNPYLDEVVLEDYNANENNNLLLAFEDNQIMFAFTNTNTYATVIYENEDIQLINFDFIISNNINDFIQYFNDYQINVTKSIFNVQEYIYNEELEVKKDITQMLDQNWHELWETNMFNWTNESILKQGLDNFAGVFGITNNSNINNLITYELIMVAIYIVIDIVLKMFTWLTHMIGNK